MILLFQVNRFLGLVGYNEGEDYADFLVWTDRIEVYDEWLVRTYQPGTVRSAYMYVRKFVLYLAGKEIISQAQLIQVSD